MAVETKVAKALEGSPRGAEDVAVRGRNVRDPSRERPGVRLGGAVRAERSRKASQRRWDTAHRLEWELAWGQVCPQPPLC